MSEPTSAPEPTAPKAAVKRDRSPAYPSLTFTEALEKTRQIWEKDKKHAVSYDLASQHMGYKRRNGATLPMIATMKRYGLLAAVGNEVRVTDDAHALLVYPDDAPERAALVRKLAMSPTLFTEVLAKFPDGLPSDDNLAGRLQADWDFASPNAAATFIRALREAVAITGGRAVANSIPGGDNGLVNTTEAIMGTEADPAIRQHTGGVNPGSSPSFSPRLPPGVMQSRPWDLGGGAQATVTLPTKLTRKNIEKLKKYVHALEVEASIAWEDDEGEAP